MRKCSRLRHSITCNTNKTKKSAHINTTLKGSSTFPKVAGFQRAEPFGRCPQTAKSPLYKRTEQGVRNAKAFRGGATKNAPPFNGIDLLYLQNVPVERFGQSNSPEHFFKKQCPTKKVSYKNFLKKALDKPISLCYTISIIILNAVTGRKTASSFAESCRLV